MSNQLPPLPDSQNEFWDGEKHLSKQGLKLFTVCPTHTKDNWTTHDGYIDNKDGSISCKYCGWGSQIPGYMRVLNGKVVDLRSLSRK